MKKISFLLILFFAIFTLTAQENPETKKEKPPKEKKERHERYRDDQVHTIFGDHRLSHGGYVSFDMDYTENILGRNGLLLGARGAWTIDHWFSMGMGGYGLVSGIQKDIGWSGNDPQSLKFHMGYGGMLIELTPLAKMPVHLTFPVLLGIGGCAFYNVLDDNNWNYDSYLPEDTDVFFIAQPQALLEINLLKHMRFGFGVTYRYVEDFNLIYTQADELNGMSYNFNIKLGKF